MIVSSVKHMLKPDMVGETIAGMLETVITIKEVTVNYQVIKKRDRYFDLNVRYKIINAANLSLRRNPVLEVFFDMVK